MGCIQKKSSKNRHATGALASQPDPKSQKIEKVKPNVKAEVKSEVMSQVKSDGKSDGKSVNKTPQVKSTKSHGKSSIILSSYYQSIALRPEDEGHQTRAPDAKTILEGNKIIERMREYYIFGEHKTFLIPVEQIFSAPATICYRKLNYEHVNSIGMEMVHNPMLEPLVADLIPYEKATGNYLTFENTPADEKRLKTGYADGSIEFYAVSGQHLAAAAVVVRSWAKDTISLAEIAKSLKYRKSRILSGKTPGHILAEHSSACNDVNITMEYKSSFLDCVVHARRQYIGCGRPLRPKVGITVKSRKDEEHIKLDVSRLTSLTLRLRSESVSICFTD